MIDLLREPKLIWQLISSEIMWNVFEIVLLEVLARDYFKSAKNSCSLLISLFLPCLWQIKSTFFSLLLAFKSASDTNYQLVYSKFLNFLKKWKLVHFFLLCIISTALFHFISHLFNIFIDLHPLNGLYEENLWYVSRRYLWQLSEILIYLTWNREETN